MTTTAGGSTARYIKKFNIDFLNEETIAIYARVVSDEAYSVTACLIWK